MNSIYKIAFSLYITLFFSISLSAHYGPRGLLGGTISCGMHHDNMVYLGTEEGGVYITTTTAHIAWRLRAVGLKSGKITALTHSGGGLFAGTADAGVYIFNGADGSDLFWNQVNTGLSNTAISSLVAVDSNTILAGTNGGGLFKTTNLGGQWTAINSPLLNSSNVVGLVKAGSRIIALTETGGVFKSDDNGDTWSDFNDMFTLNINGTKAISYNTATDEILVLNPYGLYKLSAASTSNSAVYSSVNSGLPLGVDIRSLSNNGNNWYLGTSYGVYTSNASSINWMLDNTGLSNTDITTVVATNTEVFAGMRKKGVVKTATTAINWANNNTGMSNVGVRSLTCWGDSVVVVSTEYGVMVSRDIANNYLIANHGLVDSLNVNDVQFGENILFAATENSGVFMSTDFGANWTVVNNGLSNLNIKKIFYANGKKYALDSNGKLYQSALMTNAWTLLDAGLPANAMVTSMAFYANIIIIGTAGDGVYTKHHDATTWTAFNTGLSNMNITAVTASSDKIFAGTAGSGVFVSDFNTAAWSAAAPIVISHFSNVPLDASHIQYMNNFAGYVVASFKGGVAATLDNGTTWDGAGNQFNLPSYSDYNKIDFVTTRIFVTTGQNSAQSNGAGEFAFIDTILTVSETAVTAPTAGIESFHSITSNINWQISSSEPWATASVATGFRNKHIGITVQPNTGTTRTAVVTLTGGSITRIINITQDGASSINSLEQSPEINIYPNPSEGTFTIDLNGLQEVENIDIIDATGRNIQTIVTQGQNTMSVNHVGSAGLYIVRIHTPNGILAKTIVVQ